MYEDEIRQLESEEQVLLDNLHKTITWEQQQARKLKDNLGTFNVDANFNSMDQCSNSPVKSKRRVDTLDLYQTPRTTKQLIEGETIS